MDKKSPFFTASAASAIYIIIYLLLKYFLPVSKETKAIDWLGALQGAIIFWIVIFLVHQFLKRRFMD